VFDQLVGACFVIHEDYANRGGFPSMSFDARSKNNSLAFRVPAELKPELQQIDG